MVHWKEVARQLDVLPLDAAPNWDELAQGLKGVLGGEVAGIYSLEGEGFGGFSLQPQMGVARYLAEVRRRASFDPLEVPAVQRNKVSVLDELPVNVAALRENLRHISRTCFGLEMQQQVRLLACEGPRLLAWVGSGAIERDAFGPDSRRALRALAPSVTRRFIAERRFRDAPLRAAALDALLEATVEPSFIVDANAHPVLMNQPARTLWTMDRRGTAFQLREALRAPSLFRRHELRGTGLAKYFLLVRQPEGPDFDGCAALATSSWLLSRQEAAVLALVCRGLTNAAIALALGRSERVVELHISRLFTKARVSNRASLVSAFWAGAA